MSKGSSASRKLRGLIAKCGGVRCSFKPEPRKARMLIEVWAGTWKIGEAALTGPTLKRMAAELVKLDELRSDLAGAAIAADFFGESEPQPPAMPTPQPGPRLVSDGGV